MSRPSVTMVSGLIPTLTQLLDNANRHVDRNGYVHEGEKFFQDAINNSHANRSQEVAKVILSLDAVALYQIRHLLYDINIDYRLVVNLPLTSEICFPSRTRMWSEPDVLPGA